MHYFFQNIIIRNYSYARMFKHKQPGYIHYNALYLDYNKFLIEEYKMITVVKIYSFITSSTSGIIGLNPAFSTLFLNSSGFADMAGNVL